MTDLPKGWTIAPLREIASASYGKGLRKADRVSTGDVPVIGSAGVGGYHSEALVVGPSIVIGRKGKAGAVWLMARPCWPIDTTYYLQPPHGVDARYLALNLEYQRLGQLDSSTAIPSLRREDLEAAEILLPPLAEQERIVAAIEEHFCRLDAAEASISRGERNVQRLRQSLLQDLTAGDWPRHPLHDLITHLRNGMFVSRPGPEPPGTPIFRISAVRPLTLDVSDIRYAEIEPGDGEAFRVDEGDLLFTRYSGNPAYVGACAVVPASGAGVLHPDKLIRVVPDRSRVLPQWIAMYLAVGSGRKQIDERLKTTAGQVGIAGGQLKKVEIAVPPIAEQVRLVDRWESQTAMSGAVAADIRAASDRALALRRSVLAAAFNGELVPQDPSDEPASTLLDRIRGQREETEPARRKRKARTS